MNLDECRKEIDKIDEILLQSFIKRMAIVEQVIDYKIKNGLPIFNAKREAEVIADKVKKSPNHLENHVEAFFQNMMENSRAYQQTILNHPAEIKCKATDIDTGLSVACQGIRGAYSHIASLNFFKDDSITFYDSFEEVFDAVKNKTVEYGIIPIENSTAGGVFEVYDLLKEYDLFVNKKFAIKIEHNLATKNSVEISQIKKIYSHNQALKQCSEFLKKYKDIEIIEDLNTAIAAKKVSQSDEIIAAICSKKSAEIYNLHVIESNIQNHNDNYTKFIILSNNLISNVNFDEISICMQIPNQSGELNKLLTRFTLYGINLNKIESRPIMSKDFNVLFYINFSGNINDKNVLNLLGDLQQNYEFIKILGAYESIK